MNICIITLGCPKNEIDSELVAASLQRGGHRLVDSPEAADAVIVNTCGFIQPAVEESIGVILEMAQLKEAGALKKLVVSGCMVQRYHSQLAQEIPEIDALLGTSDHLATLEMLESDETHLMRVTPRPRAILESDPDIVAARTPRLGHTAYVRLSEGCSRRCAYCIIPQLRGRLRSRPPADIAAEVRTLTAGGVKEIILIGQETTAYGNDLKDGTSIVTLLEQLLPAAGSAWLRMLYTHPAGITPSFIDFYAANAGDVLLPYIDMPIQHIDDRVLKAMRRGHGEQRIRRVVGKLRHRIDDLVLRTTVITGHPGEDARAFKNLLAFVEEGWFDRLGAFPYYPEDGTVSATLRPRPKHATAVNRSDAIMDAQTTVSHDRLQRLVGGTCTVLVDGPSEEHELLTAGRYYGQAPEIDGVAYVVDAPSQPLPGQMLRCTVTQSHDHDLEVEVIGE